MRARVVGDRCVVAFAVVAVLFAVGVSSASAAGGDQLWVSRYDGPVSGQDNASDLVSSPDGSKLFVTGDSVSSAGSDYATVAYDAVSGAQLWASRYEGGYAPAVAVSPDGSRLFVTGTGVGATYGDLEYATVAYDAATGAQLWVSLYDPAPSAPDGDGAQALGVSPDGSKVFVTGQSLGALNYDYATIAYDAATGTELWVKRYNGPGHGGPDDAVALGVSPDGSKVFVTGDSTETGNSFPDYLTIAYDATTGSKLWIRRYDGPGNQADYVRALAVGPDGTTVFVTGDSVGRQGNRDYATIAYEAATGARLWVKRYDGPAHDADGGQALGLAPDGKTLFVTGGSTGSSSGFDYATVAYDAATGARLWVTRYNGPANGSDAAHALGVSPDGAKLFVTGESPGSGTNYDYATVTYDAATGARLWVTRYNGPATDADEAYALDVSPDGSKLFVTGRSVGSGSSYDYATVAYSTG
jgi:WD40 repeat protein